MKANLPKGAKIITVDYHKTKKELIIHYRNVNGKKCVLIKPLTDYPVYIPIDKFEEFKKVCGNWINYIYDKTFHSYDYSTELVKVDMNAQVFLEKKRDKEREKITKVFDLYQADVNPSFIYMIENNLEWEKDIGLTFFDIETNAGLDVEETLQEVTSMSFYVAKLKTNYVFSWHPKMLKNAMIKQKNIIYYVCSSEKNMFYYFFEFLRNNFDYIDTLIGWSSNHFDIPYLINRIGSIGMNRMQLSPLAKYAWTFQPRDVRYNKISGINLLDYLDIYKSKNQYRSVTPPNYKLKTIASFEELGLEKMQEFTWRDWIDNYRGFLSYQVRDVDILVKLEEKLRYIRFLSDFQNIVKLPIESLT